MEISKFIKDALKDGSIDKVSKGIEQLVMMMINAIGMIERRELEFEQQLESLQEDIETIKAFLLSKPILLPGTTQTPQSPSPPTPTQPRPTPTTAQTTHTPSPQARAPQLELSSSPELPPARKGPSEEDIASFRKKLLKPTPKHEKPKPQPVSIRAALMQEMKEFFGSAMTKVKKEKKDAD